MKAKASFREQMNSGRLVRVAGAHSALGAKLAEQAGFDAVWASSFEISAARCLPDASILTMTEYLSAAVHMQKAITLPVVADCDTGYGGNMNVAHMVREYESSGISAVCIEDKLFPKMNSFANAGQPLLPAEEFARKIEVAVSTRTDPELYIIARTEALISGMPVEEALRRAHRYVDAGADAVLIHSKQSSNAQILDFLAQWQGRAPVVVVPTTYPDWHARAAAEAGVSAVIYANQGLRATITSLRTTYGSILESGLTTHLEPAIASVSDIFALQSLSDWQLYDA